MKETGTEVLQGGQGHVLGPIPDQGQGLIQDLLGGQGPLEGQGPQGGQDHCQGHREGLGHQEGHCQDHLGGHLL